MPCECRKDVGCVLQCYLMHVILSHVISHGPTVNKKKKKKWQTGQGKNMLRNFAKSVRLRSLGQRWSSGWWTPGDLLRGMTFH